MRLKLDLPFGVVILSRAVYTSEEAENMIVLMPIGFEIISDEEAWAINNPIEFPIVEEINAGSNSKGQS